MKIHPEFIDNIMLANHWLVNTVLLLPGITRFAQSNRFVAFDVGPNFVNVSLGLQVSLLDYNPVPSHTVRGLVEEQRGLRRVAMARVEKRTVGRDVFQTKKESMPKCVAR